MKIMRHLFQFAIAAVIIGLMLFGLVNIHGPISDVVENTGRVALAANTLEMKVRLTTDPLWGQIPVINITSLDDAAFTITNVIVNNNPVCTGFDSAPTVSSQFSGKPPWTLSTGQVQSVWLNLACNPIKVEIITDRGTKIYKWNE